MKSVEGIRACSDDEVLTRNLHEAVRVADSRDVDGHKLCGLGFFDVRDLLAETEFDSQLSALLIEESDEFACCTVSWSAKRLSYMYLK